MMARQLSFRPGYEIGRFIDRWREAQKVPLSRAAACSAMLEAGLQHIAPDALAAAAGKPDLLPRRYVRNVVGVTGADWALVTFLVPDELADALELWRESFAVPPPRSSAVKYFVEQGVAVIHKRPRGGPAKRGKGDGSAVVVPFKPKT